jgi:hypothetical protein
VTPPGLIDFSHSEVTYLKESTKIQFKFVGLGEFACPKAYSTRLPPPVSNTPTPNPQPSVQFSIESEKTNGNVVSINLERMDNQSSYVVLIYPDYSERPKIFFSPSILSSCPDGYKCFISETANIWKCFDKYDEEPNSCFPMGDFRYGLNLSLTFPNSNDNNLPSGINARYSGGIYQSSTIVEFKCNESLNDNEIRFRTSYEQVDTSTTMRIYAHAKSVCPHEPAPYPSSSSPIPSSNSGNENALSGGAIFLLVLVFGVLTYVIGGVTYNYIKNERFSFPNAEFWNRIGGNIVNVGIFIFTCGKRTEAKSLHYVEI